MTKETTGQCQVKGHKTNEKHIKWLTHWCAPIAKWPPSKFSPPVQYQKLSKECMKNVSFLNKSSFIARLEILVGTSKY